MFRPSPSVTAAFSPTERHVSVFFFRRQATSLVRYLKSVFFVMTFITVCWRGDGISGDIKKAGQGQKWRRPAKSKFACVKGRVSVCVCVCLRVCLRVKST